MKRGLMLDRHPQKCGRIKQLKPLRMLILAGLATGLKDPMQRGPRLVVVHGGGEDGLVKEAKLITFNKNNFLT